MATRNQVLSLFGATPEQIMERQRREQAASILQQQDPFARAGSAIGFGLARLFGGESPEVTNQRELYGMLEGVNFESPEQMRQAAATLQSQFPDRALQLLSMADSLETTQQQRSSSAAQAALAQKQADEVTRKFKVTVNVMEPLIPGGPAVSKTKEEFIDVKGTLDKDGKFVPYGGELDFLQSRGATVTDVNDELPKVNPESVGIPNSQGVDIRRQPDGSYVIANDDERIVRTLTDEEVKALGGKPVEPKKPELPIQQEKRQQVEGQIKSDRIQQSIESPSSTVFDPNNPFSSGL
jgi:hypothetical protein